jgi:hypothetical protein
MGEDEEVAGNEGEKVEDDGEVQLQPQQQQHEDPIGEGEEDEGSFDFNLFN